MIAEHDKKQVEREDKEEVTKEVKKEITPIDPAFPLLKTFREKAPGTFKHAQSLTSMIENVCANIGMDSELLGMAALYHDIGKMWAPGLFTENQTAGSNPHDSLDPEISYYLITRHVSDSVTILLANNFPLEVVHVVSQHHGQTVAQAFYDKALKLFPEVSADFFRYKTQRPDCLESLILMLCDQIESAARSVYSTQHLDVGPEVLVMSIYDKIHKDGQFDNVQIFLGTLKNILSAIITDVGSTFQKRVPYDENKKLTVEENKK